MRRRDWRQRWDPNAPLEFCRRVRVGDDPKKPFALPGDLVSDELREKVGPNRLRMWFETGTVQLAGWVPPEPQRRRALAEQDRRLAQRMRVNGQRVKAELENDLVGS